MSNPFEESDNEQILEGFLCPICKEDLKTPERLTTHVENLHSDEQILIKSLKDILSIAKKKIYKNIDETVDLAKNFDNAIKPNFFQTKTNSTYIPPTIPQEIGALCDHISYFKAIRTPRLERYASDTNQLIIRLHKLLTNLPSDQNQRKQHEQSIVPWLDGKSVKLCPSCAKNFHLARRQHHCRLCGSILCHDCSNFLDLNDAINLVNPSVSTPTAVEVNDITKNKESSGLRICEYCLHLLNNRRDMQDSRTYRPPVTILYEKIKNAKNEILPEIPVYLKMINSLYDGDTIFTIADAGALRGKIGRAAEQLDNISKSLIQLPCHPGSREESIKKYIRAECIRFIKEEMLAIPQLPLEVEIEKVRRKRKQDTEMMIERDRRLAREAIERYELAGGISNAKENSFQEASGNSTSGVAVRALDNWSGYQASASTINDPLIEQINIIKGYIKQARLAMRFEEVATLELNLRELQQEFYNRQQTNLS